MIFAASSTSAEQVISSGFKDLILVSCAEKSMSPFAKVSLVNTVNFSF